jgi:hypothetical protein
MTSGDQQQESTQATAPPGAQPDTGAPPYAGHPPPYAGYPPPYPYVLPRHPDATTALVLGGASLVLLPLLGPFAWYVGATALREMRAAPGRWSGDDLAQIGMVLGVVATALCVVAFLLLAMFLVIGLGVVGGLGWSLLSVSSAASPALVALLG